MGRNKKIGLILATILVLGGLFQNCGKGGSTNGGTVSEDSSDDSSDDGDTGKSGTPLFKAGTVIDVTKLPYAAGSGLVNKIKAKYLLSTELKAIAMASNGTGSVVVSNGQMTSQVEVSQIALERCQLFSGNRPCVIVTEGNFFKYDEAVLYQSHQNVLESGARTFNPATIPGLDFIWRDKESSATSGYVNRTNKFKAYAIGPDGAASAGWSEDNQAEATRRAYEFCENNVDQACTLYAVGNNVVFNVNAFVMGSTKYVKYGPRTFVPTEVPFVRDSDRLGNMVLASKRVIAGEHAVVALSRYGHYYISYAPTMSSGLEATALAACNAYITAGSPYKCFVYSKDLQVVFTRQKLLDAK